MSTKVSAIVLAAGRSTRMGRCKQLLPLADRPVITHSLRALQLAGISKIVVVLGANGAEIAAAIDQPEVTLLSNCDAQGDMASSIRAGAGALSPEVSGALICLADMPLVLPTTFRFLAENHARSPAAILIPEYFGQRGHPLLFPRDLLVQLRQDQTLRDLREAHRDRVIPVSVDDPGIALDMDTPADFHRIRNLVLRPT